jgi:hypothetical protein
VKVSACLEAVWASRRKHGVSPILASGEVQAAHEFAQNFLCLVMAALHETAEQVAAKRVRDVVVLDGVAAGTRLARAKGGKRAYSHADAAGALK